MIPPPARTTFRHCPPLTLPMHLTWSWELVLLRFQGNWWIGFKKGNSLRCQSCCRKDLLPSWWVANLLHTSQRGDWLLPSSNGFNVLDCTLQSSQRRSPTESLISWLTNLLSSMLTGSTKGTTGQVMTGAFAKEQLQPSQSVGPPSMVLCGASLLLAGVPQAAANIALALPTILTIANWTVAFSHRHHLVTSQHTPQVIGIVPPGGVFALSGMRLPHQIAHVLTAPLSIFVIFVIEIQPLPTSTTRLSNVQNGGLDSPKDPTWVNNSLVESLYRDSWFINLIGYQLIIRVHSYR